MEKKDTQKGRWEPVKDNIKGSEFTVPKLTEGRDYHFRVAALNDNGESEFLETDSPVTAKNPFGNSLEYFSFIKLLCFAMQGFNKQMLLFGELFEQHFTFPPQMSLSHPACLSVLSKTGITSLLAGSLQRMTEEILSKAIL